MQIGVLGCAYDPTFLTWKVTVPVIEYASTTGDIALLFSFVTGVHYNVENMVRAFF